MAGEPSVGRKILFAFLLVVTTLGALEGISRLIFDSGGARDPDLEYVVDADTLWSFAPNQRVIQSHRGIGYGINSMGLRGPEFPAAKPTGECRLLMIGDSVTFGFGVSDDQTFPHFLQEYLRGHVPEIPLLVINGGTNAYSTREELSFLRKRGLAYAPDIVVVGFVLNDFSTTERAYYRHLFAGRSTMGVLSGGIDAVKRILGRSQLVHSIAGLFKVVRSQLRDEGQRIDWGQDRENLIHLEGETGQAGWEKVIEELDTMSRLLRARGIDVFLVVFPIRDQLTEVPTPDGPQRGLRGFCERRGIPCLDLLPIFLGEDPASLFLDPEHLSPEGNALAARVIGEYLIENGAFRAGIGASGQP